MLAERIPELAALSADEKILLAAELWRDAVGSTSGDLDPILVKALRERLSHYHSHPAEGSSWEEFRERVSAQSSR